MQYSCCNTDSSGEFPSAGEGGLFDNFSTTSGTPSVKNADDEETISAAALVDSLLGDEDEKNPWSKPPLPSTSFETKDNKVPIDAQLGALLGDYLGGELQPASVTSQQSTPLAAWNQSKNPQSSSLWKLTSATQSLGNQETLGFARPVPITPIPKSINPKTQAFLRNLARPEGIGAVGSSNEAEPSDADMAKKHTRKENADEGGEGEEDESEQTVRLVAKHLLLHLRSAKEGLLYMRTRNTINECHGKKKLKYEGYEDDAKLYSMIAKRLRELVGDAHWFSAKEKAMQECISDAIVQRKSEEFINGLCRKKEEYAATSKRVLDKDRKRKEDEERKRSELTRTEEARRNAEIKRKQEVIALRKRLHANTARKYLSLGKDNNEESPMMTRLKEANKKRWIHEGGSVADTLVGNAFAIDEVVVNMVSYLNALDRVRIQRTCRRFHAIEHYSTDLLLQQVTEQEAKDVPRRTGESELSYLHSVELQRYDDYLFELPFGTSMSYKTVNGSVDEAHLVISPECYRSHAYVNSVMTRGTHYAEFTYEGSGRGVVKFGLENMPKSSVAIVHRIGQPFRSRLALYVDVDSYTMTIFQDGRVVQTVGLPRKKDSKSTRFVVKSRGSIDADIIVKRKRPPIGIGLGWFTRRR